MTSTHLINPSSPCLEPVRTSQYLPSPGGRLAEDRPVLAIWRYLWLLGRHWLGLVSVVATITLSAFYVSSTIAPTYEAAAVVDVDRQAAPAVVGQDSVRSVTTNDADQFLATQVKLIQSDAVLRPVVDKYRLLDYERQPGGWLDALETFLSKRVADAKIARAPTVLTRLKVTRPPNTFLLMIKYRSTDPELAANVANSIANSYLDHTFNLQIRSARRLTSFMEKQLDELRAKMERSSQALAQFERELNVINPEEKTNILSARLLQLNSEYTTAQTDRVRKQAAFSSVKAEPLAAAQVSGQGDALIKLSENVNAAREHLADVSTTFGRNHPEYIRAASQLAELTRQFQETKSNVAQRIEVDYRQARNREDMLHKAVATTKDEWDRLNGRSFEYKRLREEAEADRKLFDELTAKIREAGVNAGFESSTIKIADTALPPAKPVSPNIALNVALAFLGSLGLGVAAVLTSEMADTSVRDPEQVSRMLGVDVLGVLPVVLGPGLQIVSGGRQVKLLPATKRRESGKRRYTTLASYEEAIRTIRNTILLSDLERRPRSVLVLSALPGEGKSTTAIHLAIAHADQRKRTLIIDADLRRPVIHKRLNMSMDTGLSDVLTGTVAWQAVATKAPDHEYLDVIPAGLSSHRPSDLLGAAMTLLLDQAGKEYDLVVVDAPPALGFAEPLQIATAADAVVLVARAGRTSRKAVSNVLASLHRVRANVMGIVLNQFETDMSSNYYSYDYYTNRYKPYEEKQTNVTCLEGRALRAPAPEILDDPLDHA